VRKTKVTRIAQSLADMRKTHKEVLADAFKNVRISEIDIDRIYSRKLRNINVLEEFLKR
jgi:hypothetical protein